MSARRILIVDDQPPAVRVIKLALSRQGYAVECAGDGEEALEKLRVAPFDVVITDLDMPRLSGQGLCDAMAIEFSESRPLVLVVTGKTAHEVREWACGLANTELLEKPLSLKRLVARLQEHFDAQSVRDGSVA